MAAIALLKAGQAEKEEKASHIVFKVMELHSESYLNAMIYRCF